MGPTYASSASGPIQRPLILIFSCIFIPIFNIFRHIFMYIYTYFHVYFYLFLHISTYLLLFSTCRALQLLLPASGTTCLGPIPWYHFELLFGRKSSRNKILPCVAFWG